MSTDQAVWDEILERVRDHLNDSQFLMWMNNLQLRSLMPFQVVVRGEMQRNWILRNYASLLNEAAAGILGQPVTLDVIVDGTLESNTKPEASAPATSEPAPASSPTSGPPPAGRLPAFLNPELRFDNYVVGPSNRLAHAAALAVAESPGRTYNPLFLHASVGLGKTHLLQGVCHAIMTRAATTNIQYISCEQFTNEFIRAIGERGLETFRDRYRRADVLVIDDIHFLAQKDRTQEEFFHTFNSLYNTERQIILSSDSHPGDLKSMEERLVSRFKWGLVAEIEPPIYETRVAILKQKAINRGVQLPDPVAHFLAENIASNVRELEGAVTKLIGYAGLDGRPIDLALSREALQNTLTLQGQHVGVPDIQEAVCRRFGIRLTDLQSRRRTRSIVFPRQICMYIAFERTGLSYEEIGSYFGGKHHTTVMHAIDKIRTGIEKDQKTATLVEELNRDLKGR